MRIGWLPVVSVVAGVCLPGCIGEEYSSHSNSHPSGAFDPLDGGNLDATGSQICYRGELRHAEERDGIWFVEGDLEVTEQEQWCPEGNQTDDADHAGAVNKGRRAPAGQGTVWGADVYGQSWVSGVVPFEISTAFTEVQRNAILAAMADWSIAAPGVTFRARTANDASWLAVELSTGGCSSGYGRVTGARTLRLSDWCTQNFSIHHELGHALGLQHEHTRSDRDSFVTITDTNQNYRVDDGANLFNYDFDSIMHYPLGGLITLAPGVQVPTGVTVGQTTHLSVSDIASMRAMYPVASTHFLLFANTGNQPLCRLSGREQDIATELTKTGPVSALNGAGGAVQTNGLATGDYPVTCTARSLFWARNYDYPNATFVEAINAGNVGQALTYAHTANVRVLNPGLIAVMF